MSLIFIGIDYDEVDRNAAVIPDYDLELYPNGWQPGGNYRGVFVDTKGHPKQTFMTGDPQADYAAAIEAGSILSKKTKRGGCYLSSLDHFVFDVPGWRYDENNMLVRDEKDARVLANA